MSQQLKATSNDLVAVKVEKLDSESTPSLAQTATDDSAASVRESIGAEALDNLLSSSPHLRLEGSSTRQKEEHDSVQLKRWENEAQHEEPFGYGSYAVSDNHRSQHVWRLGKLMLGVDDSLRHTHVPLQESRDTKSESSVPEPLDGPDGVKKSPASRSSNQNQKRRRNELAQHLDHISEYSKGSNDGSGTKCAVGVMAQAGSPWASKFACPLCKENPNDSRFHKCASFYSTREEEVRLVGWNHVASGAFFSVLMASL